MQIRFYPNLLVTERQLHRSAPTNNESECEQLPFTRVLSNCYSVPYRWWHGLHPLCSSVCVRMSPCVCMRADILSDDMRHLANYWVLKWWRRKYVFDMDNIQHVWERCVCLCGCNSVQILFTSDWGWWRRWGKTKAHLFLPLNSETWWRLCLEQYLLLILN